jgi:hypothetical protein
MVKGGEGSRINLLSAAAEARNVAANWKQWRKPKESPHG